MVDASWKREERILAEMFGGQRLPNTGASQPDVRAPGLAIQVKKRLALPVWLKSAVEQAKRDAGAGEIPLVVLSEIKRGHRPVRLVVLALGDYLDWFGD